MCLAASAAAPTLDMLSLARLVGGAAAGGIIPLAFAIVGDRFAMTERQLALSRVLTAIIAGQLTGSIGSGFVASYFGWRVATGAATALTLVALIVTVWQLRSSAPSQPANPVGASSSMAIELCSPTRDRSSAFQPCSSKAS